MSLFRPILMALACAVLAAPASAQSDDLSALAQVDPARSALLDAGEGIALDLGLSQPVPFRVSLLDGPPRLVIDFREVDFTGLDPATLDGASRVTGLRMGRFRPGWSRLVAELDGPYRIASAGETTDTPAISVALEPTTAEEFATIAGLPAGPGWDLPEPAQVDTPKTRQTGAEPLVVVLDPGHGGIDPGAETAAVNEADLMLIFARELKEGLVRAGMRVVMTREEDVFVPLETRISVARAVGADVFLSLHADALAEGSAVGSTVYKLSAKASDAASRKLAERHDRADLLAGVDLTAQDDLVAGVLMDMARTETQPRADRLAEALAAAIRDSGGRMHKHPIQSADFSVLRAPDIPSLLIELGFLSSKADLDRLSDPAARAGLQQAIVAALREWAVADAAEALLLRR